MNFHFYQELKKDKYYHPLIPPQDAGLVVVYLYDRWKEGKYSENNFTEEAVSDAIEQVASDMGSIKVNTPRERFKSINLQLQEYFLWRNEETNLYRITPYGIDFCERLWEKLERDFNPSDFEQVLSDLIHLLREAVQEGKFKYWFDRQFNAQKGYLKSQVDSLYQQVEVAVAEFRASTKADERTFLETVREVDAQLQRVSTFSSELRDAFLGADEMKSLLLELTIAEPKEDDLDKIQEVRSFITDVKADLDIVSQRIERVRPKLRQFIYSINQRNFDRNTEQFLRYLLKHSKIRREGTTKAIQLPNGIKTKSTHQDEENFIMIQEGRIIPKLPVRVLQPKRDPEKRKARLKKANVSLIVRQKVRKWVSKIEIELRKDGQLALTPWYFQILHSEESQQHEIALKTAHYLMRKYSKLTNFKISVDQQLTMHKSFPNTAIWKMQITRK